MSRTRLAHLVVQPILVIDDGEELRPGPQIDAVSVTVSQLESYVAKLREFVEQHNAAGTDSC
jgi:hypothetical protein